MPYFLDGLCVREGTKESPGEIVKCHQSAAEALAHLQALYANVEDVIKEFVGLRPIQNRWVAVSTIDTVDSDGERYTKEAIDYGIDHARQTGQYPELRIFHVRGLRVGQADRMTRIGDYAIDEGYYDDTPMAKEAERVIRSGGLGGVSRGFHVIEAAGDCPCGQRLSVGSRGLYLGYRCPTCKEMFTGKSLRNVQFLKAIPFDITATDRPAVRGTAITNFQKELIMSRDEIKTRLVQAGFKEEVVSAWLEGLKDEDLARMKEESVAKEFAQAVQQAAVATLEQPVQLKEQVTCPRCGYKWDTGEDEEMKEGDPLRSAFDTWETRFKSLEDRIAGLVEVITRLSQSEENRLKEIVNSASPQTLTRLKYRSQVEPQLPPAETGAGIRLGDGRIVKSLSEALLGGKETK